MANVYDVASYILDKKGDISAWKLQKLCYYSQAWAYTWTEKPLFKEEFQAWANGPVCPNLYAKHRGQFIVKKSDIHGNVDALTADEKDSIDTVLRDYGDMSPSELREQSHIEEPWKNARGDIPEGAKCDKEITVESMGAYYGSL